jgi:hypothetical protein
MSLSKQPLRLFPGLLLIGYGIIGNIIAKASLPTGLAISTTGLPPLIASVCALCGLALLISTFVDRADGAAAVGAYRLVGRWYLLVGLLCVALSIALATTRTTYASDLMYPDRLLVVAALTASLFAVLFFTLFGRQHTGQQGRVQKEAPPPGKRRGLKLALAIMLCSVAAFLLFQRVTEHNEREAAYVAEDAAERAAAPPWRHDMSSFRGKQTVAEVQEIVRRDKRMLRCPRNLRSENKLEEDDRINCWAIIGQAWGLEARGVAFWFGDEGLRAHMVRFADSAWPELERHLDAVGERQSLSLGNDPDSHAPIIGWRIESGLIMSAPPKRGMEIPALWQSKEKLAREHCPYQGAYRSKNNPQGFTLPITKLWPEIDCRKPETFN